MEATLGSQAGPSWADSLRSAASAAFILFGYLPYYVYSLNFESVDLSPQSILGPSLLAFALATVLLGAVAGIPQLRATLSKGYDVAAVVLFALVLFPNETGELADFGTEASAGNVAPTVKLAGLLIVGVVLAIRQAALIRTASQVSLILAVIAVGYFATTTWKPTEGANHDDNGVQSFATLGRSENVIVFVFDTFTGYRMAELLTEYPEIARKFRGFTLYPRAIGPALNTTAGNSVLLTGRLDIAVSEETRTGRNSASLKHSFMTEAARQGFDTGYASELQVADLEANIRVYGSGVPNPLASFVSQIREYLAFLGLSSSRILPSAAATAISQAVRALIATPPTPEEKEWEIYLDLEPSHRTYLMAKFYFREMISALRVGSEQRTIRYLLTKISHPPWRFSKTGDWQDSSDWRGTSIFVFHEMARFLDKLKELGIYDNSTIIFASDHGGMPSKDPTMGGMFERRQRARAFNPLVMVKPKSATSELRQSSMTVWLGDVAATARAAAGLTPAATHHATRSLLDQEDSARTVDVPLFLKPPDRGFHSALKYWKRVPFSGTFAQYKEVIPYR
tara:strand:+ start:18032 stop:19732 length:1701 start_codon:yes stop_codon:yes gene_type:complete